MTAMLAPENYFTISTIKPMLEYICNHLLADDANDTALTNDMRRNNRNDLEHHNPDAEAVLPPQQTTTEKLESEQLKLTITGSYQQLTQRVILWIGRNYTMNAIHS